MSSNEFRDFSDECLGWAKTAKSDNECDIFLQMAQFWLEVAIGSEAGPTRVDRARHDVIARLAQQDQCDKIDAAPTIPTITAAAVKRKWPAPGFPDTELGCFDGMGSESWKAADPQHACPGLSQMKPE